MEDFKVIEKCRFCNHPNLMQILDLGDMPLVNNLLDSLDQECKKYPLKVFHCPNCTMSQLNVVVNPEILYSNYLYRSGMSQGFKDHCFGLMCEIVSAPENLIKSSGIIIYSIAENDGTFLEQFKDCPHVFGVGIEPASNLCGIATSKNIEMVNKFFSYQTAMDCSVKYGKADYIVAQNVFAHVHDIHHFMHGIKYLLNQDGTFIVEAPWAGDFIKNADLSSCYHEHLSYLSVQGMCKFVKQFDMVVDKIKYFQYMHTGTIRYYIKYKGKQDVSNLWEIENAIHREREYFEWTTSAEWPYPEYSLQIRANKIKEDIFNEVVMKNALKSKYNIEDQVVGIGAAAKATILCNFCNLMFPSIQCCFDNTPEKIGKFLPGTKIEIRPFEELKDDPRRMLIFPYNVKDEIITNVRKLNPNSKFIVAVPKLEIL